MTDAEISRRLALATGYTQHSILSTPKRTVVWHHTGQKHSGYGWYVFDYRDPAVIWPIAERFNCFPCRSAYWHVYNGTETVSDTAAKAVALAVIKAYEAKK